MEDADSKTKRIEQLNQGIAGLVRELKMMRAEREYLLAERYDSSEIPKRRFDLPDAIEKVFRERKIPMTSGQLTAAVRAFNFYVHKQSVSSTLVRFNAMNKRFKRVSPGYYYLREEGK